MSRSSIVAIMAQGYAYPLSRPLTNAAHRGGLVAYVRAAGLSVWMFSLVYPFLLVPYWEAYLENAKEGINYKNYYYAGFAFCCVVHLTLGIGVWASAPFKVISTLSGRLFTAFCATMLVISPLSTVPGTSALYALATWAVYIVLMLYWESDYRVTQRMTVFAGIVVFAWMFFLMFKLDVQIGVAIGGNNRNTTAMAGTAAMVCCMLSQKKSMRWSAIVIALFMALIVSSRGLLVALIVFLSMYYVVYKGTFRAAVHTAVSLFVFFALALAWPYLRQLVFEDVFKLHSASRGIGSGFTGRVDSWMYALNVFWSKPVFGHGFRASGMDKTGDYGAIHSGYIKILVETGFVGGFLILSTVIIEMLRRFRLTMRFRDLDPAAAPGIDVAETMRINAVAFATLIMTLVVWVYEQQYINLGSGLSLVFWLMMAAPAYITTQGQPIRQ